MADSTSNFHLNLNTLETRWNFSSHNRHLSIDTSNTEVPSRLLNTSEVDKSTDHWWRYACSIRQKLQQSRVKDGSNPNVNTRGDSQSHSSSCTEGSTLNQSLTDLDTLLGHDVGLVRSFGAGVVLLVGEGDFSFSRCLLDVHASRITDGTEAKYPKFIATSLDSEETIAQRYQTTALDNIARLRELDATVVHGFDATNISANAEVGGILDACASDGQRLVIIFNFPHHCGKGRIDINRTLLYNFFTSASGVTKSYDQKRDQIHDTVPETAVRDAQNWPSEIYVSLAPGQGGTDADGVYRRAWGNSWQIADMAQRHPSNLIMRGAFAFDGTTWGALGYEGRGRRDRGKGTFKTSGGVTHIFVAEKLGIPGHCCPEHVHDIGFWCYHTDTAAPTPALAAAPAHMCIGHACDCHPPTPSLFEMAAARKRARAGGAGATPTSVHVATPPTPPSAHPDVFVEDDFLRCVRTFIGADWLAADVELLDTSTLEAVTRGKPPATDFERARNMYTHRRTYRIRYRCVQPEALEISCACTDPRHAWNRHTAQSEPRATSASGCSARGHHRVGNDCAWWRQLLHSLVFSVAAHWTCPWRQCT
eukprot:m.1118396 g.1118396  ORF g.1118396 m.1118396 type:complete len:591 (+) comp24385_c0_seq7:188-1960(+)